jgi:ribosomal protein S18 acetylase RimI-like enzyme
MTKQNTKPEFKTERKGIFNVITEIDNAYLQAWADAGAYVMLSGGDYWIMTNHVQLLFKIQEDSMHLECISTYVDDRKQGHGSEMMKIAAEIADETNTILSLQVANVTGNGYNMGQHPVIGSGMNKKDKIPVGSLPKWYEKFGFTKSPSYTEKKRDMIYKPKNKFRIL